MTSQTSAKEWSNVYTPASNPFRLNLGELWKYRDLILLFVKRDFVAVYKQTVLGPLWHFIQPLFASAVYFAFGSIAKIPTDELPRILFYLTGVVLWNYFAACFTKTSNTFIGNAHIFGKVYFPRLAIPISIIISNLMSFAIQFLLIIPFLFIYKDNIHPNLFLAMIPVLIVILAMMGLGFGIIVSSLTIKYRDFIYLISFGIQLAMYATPVIYPLSMIPEKFQWLASLNPLTPIIEMFRYGLLGKGTFSAATFAYSAIFAFVVLSIGILLFNHAEKDFMDTV